MFCIDMFLENEDGLITPFLLKGSKIGYFGFEFISQYDQNIYNVVGFVLFNDRIRLFKSIIIRRFCLRVINKTRKHVIV